MSAALARELVTVGDWLLPVWRSFSLLRYHRKKQLLRRATLVARRKWVTRFGIHVPVIPESPQLRTHEGLKRLAKEKLECRNREQAAAQTSDIIRGSFTLLNVTRELGNPIDWVAARHTSLEHLWRFRLHEQEYLLNFPVAVREDSRDAISDAGWQLVQQWIGGNPLNPSSLDDAWHPYCISRRLLVWICLWHQLGPPKSNVTEVLRSMYLQAAYLAKHLERDLGGNHLLDNARALAAAGAFFAGAEADGWLTEAANIFGTELPLQILRTGEHFERAPMYHCQVLEMLLDVAAAVGEIRWPLARLCQDHATAMADFLRGILHPDGEIPLFGDSCFSQELSAEKLLWRARASPSNRGGIIPVTPQLPSCRAIGSYWVCRSRANFVIFDAGPVAADSLPAHAHCDLLGIEMSVAGQRFLVDSGVYNYEADQMRQYCRSTAAHSVLLVDGKETCDVWSKFRMGYRGRISGFQFGLSGNWYWATAVHDGYRRIGVTAVNRFLFFHTNGTLVVADLANIRRQHELASLLHFHPEVRVRMDDQQRFHCRLRDQEVWVDAFGPVEVDLIRGWYCPRFGERIANDVAQARSSISAQSALGWVIGRSALSKADKTELLHELHSITPLLFGATRNTRPH